MKKALKNTLIIGGFAVFVALDRSGLLDQAPAPGSAIESELSGAARVIDGDSLALGATQIRLYGIDAPEGRQRCRDPQGRDYACGDDARDYLRGLIGNQSVQCVEHDRDPYQRRVSVCTAGGQDLNWLMVESGHAVAYTRFTDRYQRAEDIARANTAGLWRGTFERPERWRANNPR